MFNICISLFILCFTTLTEASADDTCDQRPLDLMVTLLPTCAVAGIANKSFNVGRCNDVPCVTRSSHDSAKLCCMPSSTRQLHVDCADFSYTISRVVSCGCAECANNNRVFVTGVVVAAGAPTYGGFILHNDSTYGIRRNKFSFETTPQAGRIVFSVKMSAFMPRLVTLDVAEGVPDAYVEITLTPKGNPNIINARTGGQIAVVTPGMSSAVSINIPPESFHDRFGYTITGNADIRVYLSFSDPRLPDGLEAAPGRFSFEDFEGETRLLETKGVVTLRAETVRGDELFLNGKVTLTFDADALGIENSESLFLWSIDSATGDWKKSGELTTNGGGRRRRQATDNSNKANTVVGETEIPPNVPYVNADKLILRGRVCTIVVYVYYGDDFTTPLRGGGVAAYMVENGLVVARTQAVTDRDGKACVLVACGLRNIIKTYSQFGVIVHPTHHLPEGFGFTNLVGGFEFVPTVGNSANNGPVFANNGWIGECDTLDSTAYHFKLSTVVPLPSYYGSLNAVELRPRFDNSWYTGSPSEAEVCILQVGIRVRMTRTYSIISY